MLETPPLDEESSSVQAHLTIVQNVIHRMAENSRSCKQWCVIMVAAILVLAAVTMSPRHALIALAPVSLFLFLDTYYLALERAFRTSYNNFVAKVHERRLTLTDLYDVRPTGPVPRHFIASLRSFSIWQFYLLAAVTSALPWLLTFLTNPPPAGG